MEAMKDEFEVIVAAHGDGPLRDAAAELGIQFVPLRHLRRALSPIQDPLAVIELTSLFRRLRPDVVHLNSSKAGVLGRFAGALARVPVRVFTAHGWAFEATNGWAPKAYLWGDRAARPLTSMVVCVSEAGRRVGLKARTCTPERTTVIPYAVKLEEPPQRVERPTGPVEIVSVGRLAEQKDFATMIAAFALVPKDGWRLRILGEGPLRGSLEAQIDELGLHDRVMLVGEVLDVPAYLAESDIFALSSRWEGMPLSILEAMTAGLPVIACNAGGLAEVVLDGQTGFVVPQADPEKLAAALTKLIEDTELRQQFGAAGRRRVEDNFSLAGWGAAHLALYRGLLEAA